jgi:hypothetical protein
MCIFYYEFVYICTCKYTFLSRPIPVVYKGGLMGMDLKGKGLLVYNVFCWLAFLNARMEIRFYKYRK